MLRQLYPCFSLFSGTQVNKLVNENRLMVDETRSRPIWELWDLETEYIQGEGEGTQF